ncbi:MAG: EF-hand domain-containing protein [Bernardetiaceae bacterium]|jgi:Ca2+-binding EF-hand superfamily protein|nr:EF-hand domain-containing protein [Bernardetiaceae bacterium]
MLSEFQKQKFSNLFRIHDLNRGGTLGRNDFEELARRIALAEGWPEKSPAHLALHERMQGVWQGIGEYADLDQDGQVTEAEWLEFWDGVISNPILYQRLALPLGEVIYQMLDINQDGLISQQEWFAFYQVLDLPTSLAKEMFTQLDTDHSGTLSVAEVITAYEVFLQSDTPSLPGNQLFGRLSGGQA